VETLKKPISLNDIKKDKRLKNIPLVKQGRLSVMPATKDEYEVLVDMGRKK
jgi:predicted RNA-binding protein with PUA-like domain